MQINSKTKLRIHYSMLRITPKGTNEERIFSFLRIMHKIIEQANLNKTQDEKGVKKIIFHTLITTSGIEYYIGIQDKLVETVYRELRKANFGAIDIVPNSYTDDYFEMIKEGKYFEIYTKQHNCFSLKTNVRAIDKELLSIKDDLKNDDDYIVISLESINITPGLWQRVNRKFTEDLEKKSKKELEKYKEIKLLDVIEFIVSILECLLPKSKKNKVEKVEEKKDINFSKNTTDKKNAMVYDTSIALISNKDNIHITKERFLLDLKNKLDEDNNLEITSLPKKGYDVNRNHRKSFLSVDEQMDFLRFPTKEDMDEVGINFSRYKEVELPEGFYKKVYNDNKQLVAGYNHINEYTRLTFLEESNISKGFITYLAGRIGAGKSTWILKMVAAHALINRGLLLIDDENGVLSEGAMRILDYLGIEYYHVDYKENDKVKIPKGSKRTTIKSLAFEFNNTFNKEMKSNELIEALRRDAEGKLAFMEVINNKVFDENERYLFRCVATILDLVEPNEKIDEIIEYMESKEKRASLVKKINEEYDYLVNLQNGLIDEIRGLINNVEFNTNHIRATQSKLQEIRNVFRNGEPYKLDFEDAIRRGIPIIVTLPENCGSIERDTITMYLYKRVFDATSTLALTNSEPIPFTVFADEIYRFVAGLAFLSKEMVRLRKRMLRFIISIHSVNQLCGTAFEKNIKYDWANYIMFSTADEDSFNCIENKQGFTYDDIKGMKKQTQEDKKFVFYNIKRDDTDEINFILEEPKDLSKVNSKGKMENLEHFLREYNEQRVIRERKKTLIERLVNTVKSKTD